MPNLDVVTVTLLLLFRPSLPLICCKIFCYSTTDAYIVDAYNILPITGLRYYYLEIVIAQEVKFFINDFFSKCDQIPRKLRIWSHLLRKSLIENFIFCAVLQAS